MTRDFVVTALAVGFLLAAICVACAIGCFAMVQAMTRRLREFNDVLLGKRF